MDNMIFMSGFIAKWFNFGRYFCASVNVHFLVRKKWIFDLKPKVKNMFK